MSTTRCSSTSRRRRGSLLRWRPPLPPTRGGVSERECRVPSAILSFMSKPLVLLVVCAFGGLARASGVDDALQAVRNAQVASEDGASCKGLSTKLKLATEALEQARKAPARAVIQQAKGRLEVAKDFASSACSDAVRVKVTEALAAAIASFEKATEVVPAEKKGAAFRAACRANDACASDHCYVNADGDGYCSKECSAPGECPAGWQCRRPGSGAEKICIQ